MSLGLLECPGFSQTFKLAHESRAGLYAALDEFSQDAAKPRLVEQFDASRERKQDMVRSRIVAECSGSRIQPETIHDQRQLCCTLRIFRSVRQAGKGHVKQDLVPPLNDLDDALDAVVQLQAAVPVVV
jgi:hypothetical protein